MKDTQNHQQDGHSQQEQLDRFYDTFIHRGAQEAPSHSRGEGGHLPALSRFEAPPMDEAQAAFLKQFTQYGKKIHTACEYQPAGAADLSGCAVDYRKELNDAQLQAATWKSGPLLVIAGAGTGKTRTICYRTAYLVEKGVPPNEILLLTFTRKAAQEMIDRTSLLLQDAKAAQKVQGGTFHGFANQVLRRYADMIGVNRNFTILDDVDAQDVITLIRDELKLKRKQNIPVPKSEIIRTILSKSRSCETSIFKIIQKEYDYLQPYCEDVELIGKVYDEYKQAHRQMDYDDLLEVLYEKLKTNPLFKSKLHQRYRYLIVDEYQDTNRIQGRLVGELAGENRQIMVVGDDAQSIYAFRGARNENILRFPEQFPECGIIKIEENYRSSPEILTYSNAVLDSMTFAYKKQLKTKKHSGGKPEVRRFYYQQDEARWVCDTIEQLHQQSVPLCHLAVLFRSNYLSNYLQAELLKRRIPFTVYGGLKFIERRHVKDMLAYLRIALNAFDGAAWNRVLRLLPEIGAGRASLIIQTIMQNGGVFSSASFSGYRFYRHAAALEETITMLRNEEYSLYDRLMKLKGYYLPILKTICGDYASREPDLDVLAALSQTAQSMEEFLSDLALDPPSSSFQDGRYGEQNGESDHLILSTIHSSKGLEWRYVFILSMLDGIFPDMRSVKQYDQLEEERRLFYVACTRAKEGLYVSFPSYITSYNQYFSLPSRFLVEVPETCFRYFIGNKEERVTYV